MIPGSQNADIEKVLLTYPELVGKALLDWRKAELDRQKAEAEICAEIRVKNPDMNSTQVKELLHASQRRYEICLVEIASESHYTTLNETLLSMKRLAGLRESF